MRRLRSDGKDRKYFEATFTHESFPPSPASKTKTQDKHEINEQFSNDFLWLETLSISELTPRVDMVGAWALVWVAATGTLWLLCPATAWLVCPACTPPAILCDVVSSWNMPIASIFRAHTPVLGMELGRENEQWKSIGMIE
jgi:hypothetical protein